jgi:hypothetical protein
MAEAHWYCACGGTQVVVGTDVPLIVIPPFVCERCGARVGPLPESDEVIRYESEADDPNGEGC